MANPYSFFASMWSKPSTKDAFRLSIASLFLTVVAIIAGGILYANTSLSVCLVFALENIVDFLSSAVVLWRFFAPTSVDEKLERLLDRRETRASVAISFIMILLGIFVLVTALVDLANPEGKDELAKGGIVAISVLFSIAFAILALLKFRFGSVLESESLHKDGVCSFIGASLGFTFFLDVLIVSKYDHLWWFDPVISLFAGIIALWLGIQAVRRSLTIENHAVFSREWWFSDEESEPKGGSNTNVELPPLEEAHPDVQDGGVV